MNRSTVLKRLAALGVILLLLRMLGVLSGQPAAQGVVDGRLAACPPSPNCVCTRDADPQHAIAPLRFTGTAEEAIERLRKIILDQPRARIVEVSDRYLHAEFAGLVFGFVDDVEFLFDAANEQIHFRSASRLGRSDFGANRRRMERIREAWKTLPEN